MKTSNVGQGRAHQEAIIRGWVGKDRAGSTGITIRDGTTTATGTFDLTVIGGTITYNADGTAVLTIGDSGGATIPLVNAPITAALSQPPTQAELETAIATPAADVAGQAYIVTDSDTGLSYAVWSTGEAFDFVPIVETAGSPSALVAGAGIFSDFAAMAAAAVYDAVSNQTFWTYMNAAGDACVRSYDHATQTASAATTLRATLEPGDSHAQPCIALRPDRKLVVIYSEHNGAAIYQRISSAAADISAFAAETNIATALGKTFQNTYPQQFVLDDGLLLVFREAPGGVDHAGQIWAYALSTDYGGTWPAATSFLQEPSPHGSYTIGSKTTSNRVDFLACTRSPFGTDPGGELRHFYYTAGAFYTTEGAEITATLPFDTSVMTTVFPSNATQRADPGMAAFGTDNKLRVAFRVFEDDSPEDCHYYWGIFDGIWQTQEIAEAGVNSQTATCVLEPGNPSSVWWTGDDGSGVAQVHRSTTADGLAWVHRQITDSAAEQSLLAAILDAPADLKVMWNAFAGGWTRNDTVAADFMGAAFAAVAGAELQRVVALDGDALGEGLIEIVWRKGSDGHLYWSDDRGATWNSAGAQAGAVGEILVSESPSTPLIFGDLLQTEAQNDLLYADI